MIPLLLQPLHERLGAELGELRGRAVVRRYADPAREDAALRTGAGLVDLSARAWVRVTGPDRVSFLHGMVTQDVEGLPVLGAADAALLTAKGAMVSDALVVRRADDLLLSAEPGFGEVVLEQLGKYLISEDAELADASAELGTLSVVGPRAEALVRSTFGLSAPAPRMARPFDVEAHGTRAQVLALPQRLGLPGVDLAVPAPALEVVVERLLAAGAVPVGFDALEVARVEHGTPRHGADMDEKTLPLEANLGSALHYQKGCYIGQEVIARATFRGQVNRRLVGLSPSADVPPRTELFAGERRVGFVTTGVVSPRFGRIALGYVHRDVAAPGTVLTAAGGTATVTVHALPFGDAPVATDAPAPGV